MLSKGSDTVRVKHFILLTTALELQYAEYQLAEIELEHEHCDVIMGFCAIFIDTNWWTSNVSHLAYIIHFFFHGYLVTMLS